MTIKVAEEVNSKKSKISPYMSPVPDSSAPLHLRQRAERNRLIYEDDVDADAIRETSEENTRSPASFNIATSAIRMRSEESKISD